MAERIGQPRRSHGALDLRRRVAAVLDEGLEAVQRVLDAAEPSDRAAFLEDVAALAVRLDAIGLRIEPYPAEDPVVLTCSRVTLDGRVYRLGDLEALLPLSWRIWTVNHLGQGFTRGA